MSPKVYRFLMSLVESAKHDGVRSRFKAVRAFRYYKYLILSAVANWLIKHVNATKGLSAPSGKEKTVASLTTFPARINQVRYAILSILLQTVRPHRIVLWLAREQFPEEEIPENLRDLCQHGLEVRFCDDLRSHKKYCYALQEQRPDEVVITFDDDIIYHPHTIGRLIGKHRRMPRAIVVSQAHIMTFDDDGNIKPYDCWTNMTKHTPDPNKDFMPLTGSGCLYPYGVMPPITFDADKIKECAFTADDLWIGFIARVSHVPVCVADKPAKIFSVVAGSQSQHLGQVNCIGDGNDVTMQKLTAMFSEKYRYSC